MIVELNDIMVMEAKKLYFMDCHIAGRMYHDADEVWDDLKVGTILRLERDKDNRHDVNAVMVIYEKEGEEYKIGYIPRSENESNIFECRICKINEEAHPEKQVHLTIKIKRNKE